MSSRNRKGVFSETGRRVQACMTHAAPDNRTALEKTLHLLSRVYSVGLTVRNKGFENGLRRPYRLSCPVISVGNLTVGGSGKTPMTLYLAEMFVRAGYLPAVMSRGYKGKSEKKGGVVSDGRHILMGPEQAGDEPFMMAMQLKDVPFLVGADRYAMGQAALARFSPDVIILDDAFQHRRLHRDMDWVLVDATVGFGNGYLLPRGILREPKAALDRADAIVLTRADRPAPWLEAEIRATAPHTPVFRSVNRPFLFGVARAEQDLTIHMDRSVDAENFGFLQRARILGFSGIARSAEFKRMITDMSGRLVDFLEFPDHYYYTAADWRKIFTRAEDLAVDYLVTTQKDYARLQKGLKAPVDMVVIGIHMDFGPERDALSGYIKRFLGFHPPGCQGGGS